MVAEVGSMPAASSVKKPFGLRSKMGKWCCHCFPCCRGRGKSNVSTSGDHDDSAMKTLRSKMGKWCCHCFPCCRGRGKSNVGASGDRDDSAVKTLRSKMGKWCCHCFPCCRGRGKSNVGASGDHDDSAVKTLRSNVGASGDHDDSAVKTLRSNVGASGDHDDSAVKTLRSSVGAWGDYDDSAFMEPRYHVHREDLDKLHRAAWWGKVPRKDLIVMLRDTDVNKKDKQKSTACAPLSASSVRSPWARPPCVLGCTVPFGENALLSVVLSPSCRQDWPGWGGYEKLVTAQAVPWRPGLPTADPSHATCCQGKGWVMARDHNLLQDGESSDDLVQRRLEGQCRNRVCLFIRSTNEEAVSGAGGSTWLAWLNGHEEALAAKPWGKVGFAPLG
ncbi:POTE ankyrin domain family member H-like [Hylobates moloch]|uniref:POTE ankyrin domain family member H-like n=1 Tax=Hylobates moloch TaxID=81572 RepID=UPI00267682B5|nr:POTE ankyrin domain family member H-like [Hylobates moloch]